MSAIATTRFRVESAKRMAYAINNSLEFFYFFLGKPTAWANEDSPDTPVDNYNAMFNAYSEILAMKKIGTTNHKIGIKRYNWTSGEIYQYFDDKMDIFDYTSVDFKPFYVMNSAFGVYKCLNNASTTTTYEPVQQTFNAATAISANVITITGHGYFTGDKVNYSFSSGTTVVGLTNEASYYVTKTGTDTLKLASSRAYALSSTNLTITSGTGTHTLLQESFNVPAYTPGSDHIAIYVDNVRISSSSFTETTSGVITLSSGIAASTQVVVVEKRIESTVEPTSVVTDNTDSITPLADGYIWKYMFTVSSTNALSFMSTNWIPVDLILSNDSSAQYNLQESAAAGIYNIKVLDSGADYFGATGVVQATGASTVTLDTGATGAASYYNNMAIYIDSGTGSGQLRTISSYAGTTKVATISSAWTTQPTTAHYELTPAVTVSSYTGASGIGRIAYADIGATGSTPGMIKAIKVLSPGQLYQDATATLTSITGSGVELLPILSPSYGHGNDAQKELGAAASIVNCVFDGTETGTIVAQNQFRVTGLIKNPLLEVDSVAASAAGTITLGSSASAANSYYNNMYVTIIKGIGKGQVRKIASYVGATKVGTLSSNWDVNPTVASTYGIIASGTIYNMLTALVYSVKSGTFTNDEEVVQTTSGARGLLVYVDTGATTIYVIATSGTFGNYTITGQTSGQTATISSVTSPSVLKNYDDVILYENRKGVSRSLDQKEDFKVVLEF